MRRIVYVTTGVLIATIILPALAGCGLMPKSPELREIVRLTDTPTPTAEGLPGKTHTPQDEDNSIPTAQTTKTKQPTEQNSPEVNIQPGISVSARKVSQGAEIQVEGMGFPSEADVQLGFGRVNSEFDLIHEIKATQKGSFNTVLTVPDFVTPDDKWVVVAAVDNLRIKVFSDVLQLNG